MKSIYYLTYSDKSELDGLLFPNEVSQNTYALGIWVIALQEFERIPDILEFDAVNNNELQSLKMTRIDSSVYQVDTNMLGKFYFRIIRTYFRYQKYVGNSNLINTNDRLYQIVPMDIQKLNRICLEKGFFFVGKIDNNLENKSRW